MQTEKDDRVISNSLALQVMKNIRISDSSPQDQLSIKQSALWNLCENDHIHEKLSFKAIRRIAKMKISKPKFSG